MRFVSLPGSGPPDTWPKGRTGYLRPQGFPYRDEIFLEHHSHDVFGALGLDQGQEQLLVAALLGRGGRDGWGRGLQPTTCRAAESQQASR